jgi:uncharacterized protein (DUF2147 family)
MNYNRPRNQSLPWTKIPVVFLFALSSYCRVSDDTAGDAILGRWENPEGGRKMEIFKKDNLYFGKILSVTDKNVKVKPGDVVLKNLKYAEGKWTGLLKIPAKENDFDVKITMPSSNKLKIVASYGILSKTKVWKRIGLITP